MSWQVYKPNSVQILSEQREGTKSRTLSENEGLPLVTSAPRDAQFCARSLVLANKIGEVIYLGITLPLCLKRHFRSRRTRTCTGWGLPLLYVAIQEMQVILQLFTFCQCKALASIVSVALSLYYRQ